MPKEIKDAKLVELKAAPNSKTPSSLAAYVFFPSPLVNAIKADSRFKSSSLKSEIL
jgi:hypothetical protein